MSTSVRLGTGKSKSAASAQVVHEQPPQQRLYALGLLVFLIALAIRFIYLAEIRSSDVVHVLLGDARQYDAWAKRILVEGWIGREVFYQAPLYPYCLAILYKIFGSHLMVVRCLQAVIGAFSCGLLALAGAKLFSPKAGLLAGLGLAVYAPAVFFDSLIQKSVLDLLFMTVLILLIVRIKQNATRWNALSIGATLGLFALTRENALALIPIVVIWLGMNLRAAPQRKRFALPGMVLAGVAIILVPVGLRNFAVGRVFLPTTSQFGPNFYIGNNPQASGMYQPLKAHRGAAECEQQDATDLAEAATGRKLSPTQVSSYWSGKAFDFIRSAPGQWTRLLVRKWFLMWNAHELMDTESIEVYSEESNVLAGLGRVAHFGVLFPLSIGGLVLIRTQRKSVLLLCTIALAITATGALFFVMARYRFPLVPILVLVAAGGAVEFSNLLKARRYRPVACALLAAGLAGAVVNWPVDVANQLSESHCNLGIALRRENDTAGAIRHCRRAVEVDPANTVGLNNLAWMLATNEGSDQADKQAVSYAERACELTGFREPAILDTLAIAYAELGRFDEASSTAKKALELVTASGDTRGISEIQQHIDLFANKQPYRPTLVSHVASK